MSNAILQADMTTVAGWIGQGWRWWLAELRALVPPRLRRAHGTGPLARFAPGTPLAVLRNGRAVTPAPGTALAITLSPALCLVRTITVPALGEADTRRLVTLQLDQLMPFPPGAALFALRLAPADAAGRAVTIAALPVGTAEAALAAAQAADLTAGALRLKLAEGATLDFLPAWRAAHGLPDPARRRRAWWGAVAALFALNLLLLVVTDSVALRHQEELVAAHAQSATMARIARRRVLAEQQWRQARVIAHARDDPAALLAALGRRLPAGAWLDRVQIDGTAVRITGVRHEADVPMALRADTRFAGLRNSSTDTLAPTPEGQPFDIGFDWDARR